MELPGHGRGHRPAHGRFKLKNKPYNPGFVKNVLTTTFIVPKAVWEISPGQDPQPRPTSSRSAAVRSSGRYDQTQINLARVDDYWGKDVFGTPAMTTINHPIFKTNNDCDLKLESGEIDASQQFTSQIWKMWEEGARSAPG